MLVRCRNRCETGYVVQQTFNSGTGYDETGWFGGTLYKKAKKAVSSVAKVVSKVPGVSQFTAPISLASKIARGQNLVKAIGSTAKDVVADARASLPIAASVASFVPGVGTAVSSGLSAASAISQGKSLRAIAEEAALGAVPGGTLARSALRAGIGVARGQNVLKTVASEGYSYAKQNLPGGEIAQRALSAAENVARGGNVVQAVGREGIAYAAKQLPGAVPSSIKNVVSSVTSTAQKAIPMNFSRPSFGMPSSISPENVARIRQVAVGVRRPNYRPQIQYQPQTASFRPLSQNTRSWLVRGLPHMRGEVAGLTSTGAQWIVEKGDTGSGIAKKLTGNANRWTELRALNPNVMNRGADLVKKYGFPIYVGDKINLPASWIKTSTSTPAQSAPSTPSAAKPPAVSMPQGDLAAQGQARVVLTAWGKTDGKAEAGVPDYGGQPELGATAWSARDVLMGNSFANWWKRNGGPPSVNDGQWSDSLSQALNRWAEQKAQQVSNTAIAAGGVVIPQISTPAGPIPMATPLPPSPSTPTPSVTLPTQINAPLPDPWSTNPSAPAGTVQQPMPSGATQITLPQLTIPGTLTPFPASITLPTAAAPPPPANAAPQQAAGFTESQKWGLGSIGVGTALTILVRLIAA
jgi:hypothetical protein